MLGLEKRIETLMNKTIKKVLFWTPRFMGILFVLFLSLFSLDVFDMELGFWETLLAWLIHSIPSVVLLVALVLAWKWEWIGALIFIGWAILYLVAFRDQSLSAYLAISGLPAFIGLLFLLGWIWRKQIAKNELFFYHLVVSRHLRYQGVT
jgi:hypothetical protein